MATRFYLANSGSAAYTPAQLSGWETTTSFTSFPTDVVKSNTALGAGAARQKGSTTAWDDRLDRVFVSTQQLAAQTISTGTLSAVIRAVESATTADAYLQIMVRVVSSDGATQRGVLFSGSTLTAVSATTSAENGEYPTTSATRIKSAATMGSASVVASAGDRIQIEVGYRFGSTTSTVTGTHRYGDPTGTADFALTAALTTDLCPWVELSQTVTFQPPSGSGTGTWSFAGAGVGAVPADPLVATLTDSFASADTAKWTFDATATVTGGQLQIVPDTDKNGIISNSTYDLTGSSLTVELIDYAGRSPLKTNHLTWIGLSTTAADLDSNSLVFNIGPSGPTLVSFRYVAGSGSGSSTTLNLTNHRWLRIRESGGTVFWEVSPDRTTWTQRTSWTPTIPINHLYVSAYVQSTDGLSSNPTILDNVNVAPASAGSGTGSWSFAGAGVGKRPAGGSGSGTFTFAGAGTGTRTPKAGGTGTWTFVGTGAGSMPAKGSGTGSWAFAGTGTGGAPVGGAGGGSWVFTGAGSGEHPRIGIGSGTWTFVGSGSGYAPVPETHVPGTAVLTYAPGTAVITDYTPATAELTPQTIGTAVITYTPATATVNNT